MSPCETLHLPGGGLVIASSRGRRRAFCVQCGRDADKLCDFPLTGAAKGRTCDRPVCSRCATRVGPNRDYCPAHARAAKDGAR